MTDFMNDWQNFLGRQDLAQNGAPLAEGFLAPLTNFGLIAISGDEAAAFLHNQLTNDVLQLGAGNARLAGYCSPKGRLLATMLAWRVGDDIMLMLPRELLPSIQKRLQMFVLRAKVKLRDATADFAILGLAGQLRELAPAANLPDLPHEPYVKTDSGNGSLIRLPEADGLVRALWITSLSNAEAAWPALAQALVPAVASAWQLTEVHAGTPWVTGPTQEKFVPQMINFELIGGVNFKKGCYPGQEIVARSQYLGKLKRRMLLAGVTAQSVAAGAEVFSTSDPEQPCGMVVNAEKVMDGTFDCLVEIKLALAEEGGIHLGSSTGPALQFRPLPYSLSEEQK